MKADLHSHTTYSDGTYSVSELINLAISKGLDFLSITDHDCILGTLEGKEFCKDKNITIIPGIELSTTFNNESIHVLGYFGNNADYALLSKFLDEQKKLRFKRALKILKRLRKMGIHIDASELDDLNVVTRGNIAEIILKKYPNYTRDEVFDNFLGNDSAAYIPSTKLSTVDGIKLLKETGAIVVLAHPVLIRQSNIEDLLALGFDGIEAIYPLNKESDTKHFLRLATKHNLLVTAGSDFHTNNDERHGTLACCPLNGKFLKDFLRILAER